MAWTPAGCAEVFESTLAKDPVSGQLHELREAEVGHTGWYWVVPGSTAATILHSYRGITISSGVVILQCRIRQKSDSIRGKRILLPLTPSIYVPSNVSSPIIENEVAAVLNFLSV